MAIRPGRTLMKEDVSVMILNHYKQKHSLPEGLFSTRLPKGSVVAPSGPSKRHNKQRKMVLKLGLHKKMVKLRSKKGRMKKKLKGIFKTKARILSFPTSNFVAISRSGNDR
ncbi:Uncharacterized protein Fot_04095 [Forsythia ovata]|uniref:50S ribosomal protein L35 n=1 Tax=Forsythia ovata TaxID=205694 RepID=A0ABD1XAR4_9LAMI